MVVIKSVSAKQIFDSRGDKTIEVTVESENFKSGSRFFYASSPNGKSCGKYEAKPYRKNLIEDIKIINKNSSLISKLKIKKFNDLSLVEKKFKGKIGANSMIALEYSILKALAFENKKEIWELIKPVVKKFPIPIGNAIGGGKHSKDSNLVFQEFHFIPQASSFFNAVQINKNARENCAEILKNVDKNFKREVNDENAWKTSLNEEQIIEVMNDVKENMIDEYSINLHCGIDIAASEFYKNKKYYYKSKKSLDRENQIVFICNISNKFFYIEDPLEQNDFIGFADIVKNSKSLIVGDDLTVTNIKRIKKAVKMKSIRGVIIKPNQCGSLIELKKIVEFCKKKKIKTIFSHRSGETSEDILADLAFGFQADYIKTGICGYGRDEKLNRMIYLNNYQ
ncbi:MAG TPA: hypothetical protein P5277_04915 [Candidatus Paceibacterota bacterium]|nr:hypothetical protein [Candidatus Paceibacterota bacterium]